MSDERVAEQADCAAQVAALLGQIMRLQRRTTPEDWMALDLTMAQMKVLHVLQHRGASRVGDLAEALNVTAPSMTGTLERLVRQALVERAMDPADRRVVLIRLTVAGQTLVDRLHQGRQSRLMTALAQIDEPTRRRLAIDLAAFVTALEASDSETGQPVAAAGIGADR